MTTTATAATTATAVFFALQFFLRRSLCCAAVFFASQFFLRCCFLLRQQVAHKGIKFLAGSGGTPSKSKSEFRVGWWSRDDYRHRHRDRDRYRSFFCAAVFFALQFFCAAVFFALHLFLRHQVVQKGIKFLAGSAGTPSKSKSEFRVGWRSRDDHCLLYTSPSPRDRG